MIALSVAEFSGRGGRQLNEDYVGFCANDSIGCFVLADGAGGHDGGAQASRVVVQQLLQEFANAPVVNQEAIHATVAIAKQALEQARLVHPQQTQMNTTLATLMLDVPQSRAYWMHLGDSRIYLFRHGRARALTRDHSILQSMIDAGFAQGVSRGNAERNTLYASVGSVEIPARAVCEAPLAVHEGDAFLLCSDGFWESVDEQAMEFLLQSSSNPQQWINNMVAHVREPKAPTQDNFSAMAVWVGDLDEPTRIQAIDHLGG